MATYLIANFKQFINELSSLDNTSFLKNPFLATPYQAFY